MLQDVRRLLFTAETLIRYLLWEQRRTEGKEDCTHGQVIRTPYLSPVMECLYKQQLKSAARDFVPVEQGITQCSCHRKFSQPDCDMGWDSYRNKFYFGIPACCHPWLGQQRVGQ